MDQCPLTFTFANASQVAAPDDIEFDDEPLQSIVDVLNFILLLITLSRLRSSLEILLQDNVENLNIDVIGNVHDGIIHPHTLKKRCHFICLVLSLTSQMIAITGGYYMPGSFKNNFYCWSLIAILNSCMTMIALIAFAWKPVLVLQYPVLMLVALHCAYIMLLKEAAMMTYLLDAPAIRRSIQHFLMPWVASQNISGILDSLFWNFSITYAQTIVCTMILISPLICVLVRRKLGVSALFSMVVIADEDILIVRQQLSDAHCMLLFDALIGVFFVGFANNRSTQLMTYRALVLNFCKMSQVWKLQCIDYYYSCILDAALAFAEMENGPDSQ